MIVSAYEAPCECASFVTLEQSALCETAIIRKFKSARILLFLVLDFGFHVVNRVRSLDIQGNRFASESFHKDLHAATEAKDQVQRALFLDIVVRERAAVFQLLAREDQSLLIRRNSLFVLLLQEDYKSCYTKARLY